MDNGVFNSSGQAGSKCDLVCFSHLRWDFVYQRPQHLMSRFAKDRRVFFIEEPVFHDGGSEFRVEPREDGMHVVKPFVKNGSPDVERELRTGLDDLMRSSSIGEFTAWYYTPMMLGWSGHLRPSAVVYDCMDELSMFRGAPRELVERESDLFDRADLVFTGGRSLFESKQGRHNSVHCFPSSIDVEHFEQALSIRENPADQAKIPTPRVGFFGVIDERSDLELLARVAELRPNYQFVMIGPVVKIDEADLPRRENIHYLGGKQYSELPKYIAGWDAAMMPFAINDSTKFISPTKTPEYLAAGRPVVSTAIRDVVRPYGDEGLVHIAETAEEFAAAIDRAIETDSEERRQKARAFLSEMSWDRTQRSMAELIDEVVQKRGIKSEAAAAAR